MITQRLGQLPNLLGLTPAEFEREVGMSDGVLRKALSKDTHISSKWIEVISEKFPINAHWIATGKGKPLLDEEITELHVNELESDYKVQYSAAAGSIPLISEDQLTDFDKENDFSKCTMYHIPDFSTNKGDFLIRLNEDSMLPTYKGGSLFICKLVTDTAVIQWGKIFLLSTNSGTMLKRLFPSEKGEGFMQCKTDNLNYPPFEIKQTDIIKLYAVVGVVSFE